MTAEEIKEAAKKYANECELKSDFPHHWGSTVDGFIQGFEAAEAYHQQKLKSGTFQNGTHHQKELKEVGTWRDFTPENTPEVGQEYLIVWETYPPEMRVWKRKDIGQDFSTLRWMPIPKYR